MDARSRLRALPGADHAPRLLSVDEVAARLDCSRRTVFRLIEKGDLPSLKAGRVRRVVAADVDAYITRETTRTP